jgi:hypothetical protein
MSADNDTLAHRASIKSYAAAMLDFFGKNGKDTTAFMGEMKALSDSDKYEFRVMLKGVGYGI